MVTGLPLQPRPVLLREVFVRLRTELGIRDVDIYRGVMSRSLFYAGLDGKRSWSTEKIQRLRRRLQGLLDQWVAEDWNGGNAYALHDRLCERLHLLNVPFLRVNDSPLRVVVDGDSLIALARTPVASAAASPATKNIVIKFSDDLDDRTLAVRVRAALAGVRTAGGDVVLRVRVQAVRPDGCSELVVEVGGEEAEAARAAFAGGRLAHLGIIDVYEIGMPDIDRVERLLLINGAAVDFRRGDAEQVLAATVRAAAKRARLLRPWRRLRWLLSPNIADSPVAHGLHQSSDRAYARSPVSPDCLRQLRTDLVASLLLWPVTAAIVAAGVLTALGLVQSPGAIALGIVSGLALAIVGAQPCAVVVSPWAVGGGTTLLTAGFGVVHTILIDRFAVAQVANLEVVRGDMFTAVVGGVVGMSAPDWPGRVSAALAVGLLAVIAVAIGATAWTMGQPRRALPTIHGKGAVDVGRALLGASAGAAIGLIAAVTAGLAEIGISRAAAFAAALCLVGGATCTATVRLAFGGWRAGTLFGLSHGAVSLVLCWAVHEATDDTLRLLMLSAATGWFHATFFTAAFIVGSAAGSPRTATVAATLEGAGGFLGFVLWRLSA